MLIFGGGIKAAVRGRGLLDTMRVEVGAENATYLDGFTPTRAPVSYKAGIPA